MNKIFFALLILLFILIEVYRNYIIIIRQRRRPVYLYSNLLRVFVLILLNLLYCGGFSIELTLLSIAIFAVVFDPLLALSEGKTPFYINRTAQAGWWDRILTKIGPFYQLYLFAEVLFLLFAINTYIVGWHEVINQITGNYNWERDWIW